MEPVQIGDILARLPVRRRPTRTVIAAKNCEVSSDEQVVIKVARHTAMPVVLSVLDGDGNETPVETRDGFVRVLVDERPGWVAASCVRDPDDLDALASLCGERDENWVRLASALRTDNKLKLKVLSEKVVPKTRAGHELLTRARARVQFHTLNAIVDTVDLVTDVAAVQNVRMGAEGVVDEARLAKLDKHGVFLHDYWKIFGDENAKTHTAKHGGVIDAKFLRDALTACPLKSPVRDMLTVRVEATEAATATSPVVHSVRIEGPPSISGTYTRVPAGRGLDRATNEGFHSWELREGKPIYAHARRPKRAVVFDSGLWHVVDDWMEPKEAKCSTFSLGNPRAYRGARPTAVHFTSVARFCDSRRREGDVYARRNKLDFAQLAYTEGIEFLQSDPDVPDAVKVGLYLGRASVRPNDCPSLRASLRDLDLAGQLAPDDPRLTLQRAKLHALLGDSDTAVADFKTALATMEDVASTNGELRNEAKHVRALLQDQRAHDIKTFSHLFAT